MPPSSVKRAVFPGPLAVEFLKRPSALGGCQRRFRLEAAIRGETLVDPHQFSIARMTSCDCLVTNNSEDLRQGVGARHTCKVQAPGWSYKVWFIGCSALSRGLERFSGSFRGACRAENSMLPRSLATRGGKCDSIWRFHGRLPESRKMWVNTSVVGELHRAFVPRANKLTHRDIFVVFLKEDT